MSIETHPMTGRPGRRRIGVLLGILAVLLLSPTGRPEAADSDIRALLEQVGIPPESSRRGQMDTVGFVTTAAQMDSVRAQSRILAASQGAQLDAAGERPLIAAICPHDDYCYASRLYELAIPRIRARTVIVFGVFHKAAAFGARDRLVFDSFTTWRGPYGPVKVSPVREEILRRLPPEDYVVNDTMQTVEHSVEAIVPFLQSVDPEVEIVSILVPSMDWETLDSLADDLSSALADIVRCRAWRLGEDLAFVISSDAVHYGDSQWGGRDYADFGTDIHGYRMAVDRDMQIAGSLLTERLEPKRLQTFLYTMVEKADVTRYRITWCGRFSIPLGLDTVWRLSQALGVPTPAGAMLDYGTSVGEASLDLTGLGGLGVTAPNNFHHFVGYAAIGYK